jgi:hypothetical protein
MTVTPPLGFLPMCRIAIAVVAFYAWPGGTLDGHEVPADVAVQAYVRPSGGTLTLLVRVPLMSMRDVEFPLRGRGYLDLADPRMGRLLRDAAVLWIADYVQLFEGDAPLGRERVVSVRVSLPSDRSFASFSRARAHALSPGIPPETELLPDQALLDVLFEVPIASDEARFSIEPEWAHLGVETVGVIHFLPPDGAERVFQYTGNPGVVHLDPRWHQAFLRFVKLGFLHILDGTDHLLFILCLVVPFRRLMGLVPIVTAFTVAHSITLIASASGMAPSALWFPPFVETLIAASIVYMALENIVGARLHRRWLVAFAFGLVHGFGFSFVLRESLQFAGSHLVGSLLAFNIGVELGQILVLLLMIPVLDWLFRKVVPERMGTIILSALITHTAWHWMTGRGAQLTQYRFSAPVLDVGFVVSVMRWVMLGLVCVGAAWLLAGLFHRWTGSESSESEEPAAVANRHP